MAWRFITKFAAATVHVLNREKKKKEVSKLYCSDEYVSHCTGGQSDFVHPDIQTV